jgi:hypothetical protein
MEPRSYDAIRAEHPPILRAANKPATCRQVRLRDGRCRPRINPASLIVFVDTAVGCLGSLLSAVPAYSAATRAWQAAPM